MAYVAPKPRGAQKRKIADFRLKVHFSRRKSATKFLCVNTASGRVVEHLLAYLTVQKLLMVDVLFYVKFGRN